MTSSSLPLPFSLSGDELLTERLVLRPWTAAEVSAVLDGPRSDGWAGDFPAEGDGVIAGFLRDSPEGLHPYGHRLVAERDGGLVIGSIGLFWPPNDGVLELGYGVVPSRQGRGYASEAAGALAGYGLTAPGVHTVRAQVELANPASVRVLEKAGLRRVSDDGTLAEFAVTAD
ncbi:GNAT family N-acetyltransferase [Streptomyces sp. NPDC048172]|uniref:GNAT family N-acetyltransferase n=1 Tax=Streptomyces sp. NPDC048172 TaxID=3365505 RepID=UPI00371C84BD